MMSYVRPRCSVTLCDRASRWCFNTTLGSLSISWYACEIHRRVHEKDNGKVPTISAKKKASKR